MIHKLSASLGAWAVLGLAFLVGSGCTPTDRDFASGGAGGAGGGCPAGFAECDGNPDTVCETDTNASSEHCGMCNNACSAAPNASTACVLGACTITSCSNDLANCDDFYQNGCETNPSTSFDHCGMCGNSCQAPDAITACVSGACQLASCVMGKLDCDMDPKTGCEVDPMGDINNCGACGTTCTLPNATMECANSACNFVACSTNFGDCNQNQADGCEADLLTNPNHCNACGASCNGGGCKNGVCNPPILVGSLVLSQPGKMALFNDTLYIGSRNGSGDITSLPTMGGFPNALAPANGAVNAMFVLPPYIFVASNGGTIRFEIANGNKYSYGAQTSRGVVCDGVNVYWAAITTIRTAPVMGGGNGNLLNSPATISSLTSDKSIQQLYWTTVDGTVWSTPIISPLATKIASGPVIQTNNQTNNIVVDDQSAFWYSSKGLHWAPLLGGAVTDLVQSPGIRTIALDGNYVYWTDESNGTVQRISKDGSSPPEILATNQGMPDGLVVDAQYVYWSNSGTNEIWKILK